MEDVDRARSALAEYRLADDDAQGALMLPLDEDKVIGRMQRINRIGKRTLICMCIMLGVVLVRWLLG
jgi:hypothetical protein